MEADMASRLGEAAGTLTLALNDHINVGAPSDTIDQATCAMMGGEVRCGCRVSQCLQGSLVADAIRARTGADVGMVNAGSIRAALPSGTVSTGDLIEMLPFNNEVSMGDPHSPMAMGPHPDHPAL